MKSGMGSTIFWQRWQESAHSPRGHRIGLCYWKLMAHKNSNFQMNMAKVVLTKAAGWSENEAGKKINQQDQNFYRTFCKDQHSPGICWIIEPHWDNWCFGVHYIIEHFVQHRINSSLKNVSALADTIIKDRPEPGWHARGMSMDWWV